eukprot:7440882-Pyramimonas_sp.AAC.1
MQSLFVEAVHIAHGMFLVHRDPFRDHPHSPSVLVANIQGFDLDGPTIRRHPDGSIMRPPPGRSGCPARAGTY